MHYIESKFPGTTSALAARRVKTALAPNAQQLKQELQILTSKVSETLHSFCEQFQGSILKISHEYPSLAAKVALAASMYEPGSSSSFASQSNSFRRAGDPPTFASSSTTTTTTLNPLANTAAATAPSRHQNSETHLVVFVNGLFGSPSNWAYICEEMQNVLDRKEFLLHPSQSNCHLSTYEGIDICGDRLAEEIRSVVRQHPSLQRISVVGHSMGGLMARYALGVLFDPLNQTVAGLQPVHFITMATPHLGCDADGEAQVPFIGWSSMLPLVGNGILKLLQLWSTPVASMVLRRTGQQFFLADNPAEAPSCSEPPLLVQMSEDVPQEGRHFFSALASFRTRTAYANTTGDHLVGWANSSLRFSQHLPPLPPQHIKAKGVVLEDPLATAFCHVPGPTDQMMREMVPLGQSIPNLTTPPAAQLLSASYPASTAHPSTAQPHMRGYTTGGAHTAASGNGHAAHNGSTASATNGAAAAEVNGGAAAAVPAGAAGTPSTPMSRAGSSTPGQRPPPLQLSPQWRQPSRQSSEDLATKLLTEIRNAAADGLLGRPMSPAAGGAGGGAAGAAAAAAATPRSDGSVLHTAGSNLVESAGQAAQHDLAEWEPHSEEGPDGWSDGVELGDGSPEAAEELERQLGVLRSSVSSASISSASSSYVTARSTMSIEDWAADVNDALNGWMMSINTNLNDPERVLQRQQHTALMLERLQGLPWRRIDVCFKGATWGFAHNNIQVTRKWWNFEGKSVARHLAEQVRDMDSVVKQMELLEAQHVEEREMLAGSYGLHVEEEAIADTAVPHTDQQQQQQQQLEVPAGSWSGAGKRAATLGGVVVDDVPTVLVQQCDEPGAVNGNAAVG